MGYVIQQIGLFPHMTIEDNIATIPKILKWDRERIDARVTDPKIMLLDEPFGAIDAITRLNLQNELKRIHDGTKKTFLLVTHDINEAFKLGNRVMIMNEGKLLQFDTPTNIVRKPADAFVETLIRSARDQEEFWEAVKVSL